MRSSLITGKSFACVTLRTGVLLVAVVSRIFCLFLVSQWPRYFHTYHTSSELLHPNALPIQDRAKWRAPGRSDGLCRSPWILSEQTVTGGGYRWRKRSCQEHLSRTANGLKKKHSRQLSQQQSIPLPSGRHRAATLLPVVLPVNVDGLHMLAQAPLYSTRVQAFLASSDKQNFVPGTTPLSARRPLPFPVCLNSWLGNQQVANKWRTVAFAGLSAAGAARAENLEAGRWLWQLLKPLLSWDGEYYIACALQRTTYFFEMTHAFFPGLGTTYLAVKDFFCALQHMLSRILPGKTADSKFSSDVWSLSDAFVLSDATCYGIIAVIVSNVSFVLATLGVFEIALVLSSLTSGERLEATTVKDTTDLKVDRNRLSARQRLPMSALPLRMIDAAARQRHLCSCRRQTATLFKNPGAISEPWNATISIPTGSIYRAGGFINNFLGSPRKNYIWTESVAFWAAFWYAFSGASIHMSAAYTESLFACLSVWGLLLLLWAEGNASFVGGTGSSQLVTTEMRRTESTLQILRTDVRDTAPEWWDSSVISQLRRRKEEPQHIRGTGVIKLARQYCFSWTATLLFCSAALLRSNGTLSLIPLFFHTLRTCPGVNSIQTLFSSSGFSSKRRGEDGGCRLSSTLHTASTPVNYPSSTSNVSIAMAALFHWVNALLQAFVVLLPLFLVLAYPYYLYCACPVTLARTHSHPDAQWDTLWNESRHCQFVPCFPGQPTTMQSSSPCVAPSLTTIRFVQTDSSAASSFSTCSTVGIDRSESQSCPLSFLAFALSVLQGGLAGSLQSMPSSVETYLVNSRETRLFQSPYNHVSEGAKECYDKQKERLVSVGRINGRNQPLRHSDGSYVEVEHTRPPWCSSSVPSVYTYAQRQYWGVEFLGFLRVKTLYLIAMSIPFYAVSVLCVIHFLTRRIWSPEESSSTRCHQRPYRTHHQPGRNAEARRPKPSTSIKTKASFWSKRIFFLLLEKETGQVIQLAVLSIVMFFFAHANVFVRLSTACPVYFLHMARLHAAYNETIQHINEHQSSRGQEATLALEGYRRTKSCDNSTVEGPMGKATIIVSDSEKKATSQQLLRLPGAAWWEWCSAFVLVHHFLGPLLFSCYITWT